jgi:hypothetical protein
LFTSKDQNLNKAHVRYLESRLVRLAHEAGRAEVDNANAPNAPSLSEAKAAEMDAFLDEMLVLLPVLDVRAFEQIAGESLGLRLKAVALTQMPKVRRRQMVSSSYAGRVRECRSRVGAYGKRTTGVEGPQR